jgi:two-component system response regulator YesN
MNPMRNVMLVDDDVPVLDFMKRAIDWEQLGLRLVGMFENGAKAYEYAASVQAPDILVTDIGMPHMNGLQLIEKVKALRPELSVVILSCHDEFKYAQQAIKLGVDDYILKETIEPEMLGELLRGIVARLEGREAAVVAGAGDLADKLPDSGRSIVKERFIRSMLYNPLSAPEAWKETASEFGIRLGSAPYLPVLLVIDRFSEARARFVSEDSCMFAVENVTDELLGRYGGDAASFRVANRELLLLFGTGTDESGRSVGLYRVEPALRRIRGALGNYLKLSVSFVAGGSSSVDPHRLRDEMRRLAASGEHRFYLPEGTIGELAEREFSRDDLFAYYPEALETFRHVVLRQEAERIEPVVRLWADRIRERRFAPETVKQWFMKLLLDLHMKFMTMERVPSAFSREALHQTFLEADRLDRLASIAAEYMREAAMRMSAIYGQPRRAEISEAQRFVALNAHRKISLEEVAAHLHLNASYFSRLFKKETNETFVDFVTRTKMEKAKELLDLSRYTVHEIAERLGYDNKSYFVKLFKAHCGMKPGEYAGKARE